VLTGVDCVKYTEDGDRGTDSSHAVSKHASPSVDERPPSCVLCGVPVRQLVVWPRPRLIYCGDFHFQESKCFNMAVVFLWFCVTLLLDNARWILRKVSASL
jgi:hypothetical protein